MLKEFSVLSNVNTSALFSFNESLQSILKALDKNTIFSDNYYSYDSYRILLKSFIDGQRDFIGQIKPGSWSIVPNDKGMDSDARVEFVFIPTYLVTAILSRTLCEYPLLAISIPGYSDALHKGMMFCSYRHLRGHGYDAISGMIDSLKILSMGKVPWLLEHYPNFCPELYKDLIEAEKIVKNNNCKNKW